MATEYGVKTASILDVPIARNSYVVKYLNANGVDWVGANSVKLLNYDISQSTLDTYDETSFANRSATGVEFGKQDMAIAYNKYKFLRIQDTLGQDTPIASIASKVARTWADEHFVPDFDAYALAKIYTARPVANRVTYNTTSDSLKEKFFNTVSKVKAQGGRPGNMIAWIPYSVADTFKALVTSFDGSDLGYTAGKNGVLGPVDGVMVVETDDTYFSAAVHAIVADKRAIVAPVAKMDPKGNGMKLIKDVPGFGGSELQLRARGDVFVFGLKVKAIASLEKSNS